MNLAVTIKKGQKPFSYMKLHFETGCQKMATLKHSGYHTWGIVFPPMRVKCAVALIIHISTQLIILKHTDRQIIGPL